MFTISEAEMCSELTYNSVRIAHQVREHEERRAAERKKHLLCIVTQHLRDEGYLDSARLLAKESGLADQYEVCDNIDLSTIVKEFEDYYYVRFQKHPKLCKKSDQPGDVSTSNTKGHVRRKPIPRPARPVRRASMTSLLRNGS